MKYTKFEQAYIECMLWSSTDFEDEPLDSNYDINDLTPEAVAKIKTDCNEFITKAGALLDAIDDEQAGHDFWLTRNRHGAGFWDRGLGDIGDKLTELSQAFGELDVFVTDDGSLDL